MQSLQQQQQPLADGLAFDLVVEQDPMLPEDDLPQAPPEEDQIQFAPVLQQVAMPLAMVLFSCGSTRFYEYETLVRLVIGQTVASIDRRIVAVGQGNGATTIEVVFYFIDRCSATTFDKLFHIALLLERNGERDHLSPVKLGYSDNDWFLVCTAAGSFGSATLFKWLTDNVTNASSKDRQFQKVDDMVPGRRRVLRNAAEILNQPYQLPLTRDEALQQQLANPVPPQTPMAPQYAAPQQRAYVAPGVAQQMQQQQQYAAQQQPQYMRRQAVAQQYAVQQQQPQYPQHQQPQYRQQQYQDEYDDKAVAARQINQRQTLRQLGGTHLTSTAGMCM